MVFKITINEQTEYIDAKSIIRISAMTENRYRDNDSIFFPRSSNEYENFIKTSVINHKLSFNIDLKGKGSLEYSIIMDSKTNKEATKDRFKKQYFNLIGSWMQCISSSKYTLPDSRDFKFSHIMLEEKTEDSEMDIKDIKATINLIKKQIS